MEQDCVLCTTCGMLQSFVLMYGRVVQMKEKYTKMRPYGEWLAEQTVILQQIIDAVPEEQRQPPPVLPAGTHLQEWCIACEHILSSNLERSAKPAWLKQTGRLHAPACYQVFSSPLKRWGRTDWLAMNGRQAKLLS